LASNTPKRRKITRRFVPIQSIITPRLSKIKPTDLLIHQVVRRITMKKKKFDELTRSTESTWLFFITILIQLSLWISKYENIAVEL